MEQVRNLVNANHERLGYLRDRWQDEKEYEDFEAYAAEMKKLLPKAGLTFVGATKKPFGFKVKEGDTTYQVFVNSRTVGFQEA